METLVAAAAAVVVAQFAVGFAVQAVAKFAK